MKRKDVNHDRTIYAVRDWGGQEISKDTRLMRCIRVDEKLYRKPYQWSQKFDYQASTQGHHLRMRRVDNHGLKLEGERDLYVVSAKVVSTWADWEVSRDKLVAEHKEGKRLRNEKRNEDKRTWSKLVVELDRLHCPAEIRDIVSKKALDPESYRSIDIQLDNVELWRTWLQALTEKN